MEDEDRKVLCTLLIQLTDTTPKTGYQKRAYTLAVLIFLISIVVLPADGASAASPAPIRLHTGDWDSIKLVNAVAIYILHEGYGYQTQIIPRPEKVLADSLSSGDIDVSLEVWKENHPMDFIRKIEEGTIKDLGPVYRDASQNFIISKWTAEAYNITSLEDMKQYWYLLKDPMEPNKGIFLPGLISWFVYDVNGAKLKATGLDAYYNSITMPSGRSYEEIFMTAALENRTIFGHYWAPSTVMGFDYWTVLKEPDYGGLCDPDMTAGSDPSTSLCPFADAKVHKLIFPELETRYPSVIPFFQKMDPGTEAISQTLAYGYLNSVHDYNDLARYYLKTNPDRWRTWVDDTISERVSLALDRDETGDQAP